MCREERKKERVRGLVDKKRLNGDGKGNFKTHGTVLERVEEMKIVREGLKKDRLFA